MSARSRSSRMGPRATRCSAAFVTRRSSRRPREWHDAADPEGGAASGNPPLDRRADWIDYEAAGASRRRGIGRTASPGVLRLVSLEEDFYAFGLRTKLSDATDGDSEEMFLDARRHVSRPADEGRQRAPTSSPSS